MNEIEVTEILYTLVVALTIFGFLELEEENSAIKSFDFLFFTPPNKMKN